MSQPVPVPGREQALGGATGRTLEEHYELLEVLGRGSFSVVHRARHRQTGELFACKVIDKWSIHNRQRLANEIEVLQRVSHPSVIRLHDIFETDRVLGLVTDIAAGGELFDKIVDKGHYSEKEASDVLQRLLHATAHLHSHGIVHRDIKPENILLAGTGSDVDVKLSDFGLAKVFSSGDLADAADGADGGLGRARAFTVCGTDYYVAPEVLQQAGYTQACDLWSIGVVLYILLSGCPPFYEGGEEGISVQRKIVAGAYSFPERYWAEVSAEAKDLVSGLLQTDPAKRLTAQQSLEHSWVKQHGVREGSLPRQNAELFRTFNHKRKNSVAGSPLVGSYSLFGSLQSPADSSLHMPGKHKRPALPPPAPSAGAGTGAGAACAVCAGCGGCAGSPAVTGRGHALPPLAHSGGCGGARAHSCGGCGASCGCGGFGGCGARASGGAHAAGGAHDDREAHGAHHGGAGRFGPSQHGGAAPACGGHASGGGGFLRAPSAPGATAASTLGVPIPQRGRPGAGGGGPLCAGTEFGGSLSASPPAGLLSASPNPGGAFMMEM